VAAAFVVAAELEDDDVVVKDTVEEVTVVDGRKVSEVRDAAVFMVAPVVGIVIGVLAGS
jgi:hypothetical protein